MLAPFLAPIVASAFTWLLREVVLKFIILASIFSVVSFFVPFAISYIANFINTDYLNDAFYNVSPGVWWWLDTFNFNFGLPLIISAHISRFLIRRLPVIG